MYSPGATLLTLPSEKSKVTPLVNSTPSRRIDVLPKLWISTNSNRFSSAKPAAISSFVEFCGL